MMPKKDDYGAYFSDLKRKVEAQHRNVKVKIRHQKNLDVEKHPYKFNEKADSEAEEELSIDEVDNVRYD